MNENKPGTLRRPRGRPHPRHPFTDIRITHGDRAYGISIHDSDFLQRNPDMAAAIKHHMMRFIYAALIDFDQRAVNDRKAAYETKMMLHLLLSEPDLPEHLRTKAFEMLARGPEKEDHL